MTATAESKLLLNSPCTYSKEYRRTKAVESFELPPPDAFWETVMPFKR